MVFVAGGDERERERGTRKRRDNLTLGCTLKKNKMVFLNPPEQTDRIEEAEYLSSVV